MPAEWTEEQIKKRRSHTHGPGPNDEPPDEEEEARTKAEKAAQNERELEESKRMEREQWEARERELEASWTKRVRTKGTGQQCYAGAFVRLHLTGRAKLDQSFVSQRALETGFKDNSIFEDSRERGVPNMLLVGRGILVPGLEKALLSMCAGEHAEVTIQPEGGYGTAGSISNPVVPGSATLTYDVEILTVEKEEELWELSFETKVESDGDVFRLSFNPERYSPPPNPSYSQNAPSHTQAGQIESATSTNTARPNPLARPTMMAESPRSRSFMGGLLGSSRW